MSLPFIATDHSFSAISSAMISRNFFVEALEPANDNHGKDAPPQALDAALRYFAQHGLAAADEACKHAHKAALQKNIDQYNYWRDICHALDRRMAHRLDCSFSF